MAEQPEPEAAVPAKPNYWIERTDYIRTVTKWVIGGIAAAVSLGVGSSPLTNIGALPPGWRLVVAILSGLTGVAAMGWSFMAAVGVLQVRLIDLIAIAQSPESVSLRDELDQVLRPRLPLGINGVAELVNRFFQARTLVQQAELNPQHVPAETEQAEIAMFPTLKSAVDRLIDIAGFMIVQNLFRRFWRRLSAAMPVTAAAFIVFAWAANPPKQQDDSTQKKMGDLLQAIQMTLKPPQQPCVSCCNTTAACPPAAPQATDIIPANCVTVLVASGKATCLANEGDADPRVGRTYALIRPGSLDLTRIVLEAIADIAKMGQHPSNIDVAKSIARRIADSFADEFGKRLAGTLFEHPTSPEHDQPGPVESEPASFSIWFSMPSENRSGEVRFQTLEMSPFDTGRAEIRHVERWGPKLSEMIAHAIANRCRMEIIGYADRRGSAAYNLYLGMQRATAIERWMMARANLSRRDIAVRSAGAFGSGCETDSSPDLACNRHVDVSEFCPATVGTGSAGQ